MNKAVYTILVVAGLLIYSCNDKEENEELDYHHRITSPDSCKYCRIDPGFIKNNNGCARSQ